MEYKIYSVKNYDMMPKSQFDANMKAYDDISDMLTELKNDNYYHLRLKKDDTYIFYLDLDGFTDNIDEFNDNLVNFFEDKISLTVNDIKYSQNVGKADSYHISIPKIYGTTSKIKSLVLRFVDAYYSDMNGGVVDTTVYSDKWFRLPNQTKGKIKNKDSILSRHRIINGKMKDFILNYIPNNSFNIDNIVMNTKKDEDCKKEKKEKKEKDEKKETIEKGNNMNNEEIFNKINDEKNDRKNDELNMTWELLNILNREYYDSYELWRNIGFILKKMHKNTGLDYFELFDKFSQKSNKYKRNEVKNFYDNMNNMNITINVGSLYYYARLSNLNEYKNILRRYNNKNNIDITEKYICNIIKKFAGEYFIFIKGVFYSFNVENNFWYKNKWGVLKKYINDDIYDYLKIFLNDSIEDNQYLKLQLTELKKHCVSNFGQQKICDTYENRFSCMADYDDIKFDEKMNLLGFKNGVYDILNGEFRNYKYDDYMTMNTRFNYYKPESHQIDEINKLFSMIETNKEKLKLLKQCLASGLIGKQFQKLFIFNGVGGNGKSTIIKFMEKALGDYYQTGNVKTLCEDRKQGGNTEIGNLNKKRFIVFSEPNPKDKIKNGTLKELTGDSTINARCLYENDDQVKLLNTTVLLCNKKILLEGEAEEGEARRIVDFLFESRFLRKEDEEEIDNIKNFKADSKYENDEFLEENKMAFLTILLIEAKEFLLNNENFTIPQIIRERSKEYINKSYVYLEYLNSICVKTKDDKDIIKIHDLFNMIKKTDEYQYSTKNEKRNMTIKSMIEFFSTNKNTCRYYHEKLQNDKTCRRNILTNYKFIDSNENDENLDFCNID